MRSALDAKVARPVDGTARSRPFIIDGFYDLGRLAERLDPIATVLKLKHGQSTKPQCPPTGVLLSPTTNNDWNRDHASNQPSQPSPFDLTKKMEA